MAQKHGFQLSRQSEFGLQLDIQQGGIPWSEECSATVIGRIYLSHHTSRLFCKTVCWCGETNILAMNTQQEPTLKRVIGHLDYHTREWLFHMMRVQQSGLLEYGQCYAAEVRLPPELFLCPRRGSERIRQS